MKRSEASRATLTLLLTVNNYIYLRVETAGSLKNSEYFLFYFWSFHSQVGNFSLKCRKLKEDWNIYMSGYFGFEWTL